MSRTPSPYDVASVKEWYRSLASDAIEIAELATPPPQSRKLDTSHLLRAYLNNSDLRKAFGGLDSLPIPSSTTDNFSIWYIAVWARRCIYFLGSILAGITRYADRCNKPELNKTTEAIRKKIRILKKNYRRERPEGDTLLKSLKNGHGVANFLISYTDPILFSFLFHFISIGREYSEDKLGSRIYKEAGIENKDDFEKLQEKLMEEVRQEVSRYTSNGKCKSDILMDDSTLWWAAYELIRFYDDEFCIDENNKDLSGTSLSLKFVKNLITWTKNSPASPYYEMALLEVTCEIHCELRTQLQIIKNGLNLYTLFESKNVTQDSLLPLKEFIDWELAKALNSWEDKENEDLRSHAYFIGLALEVLCRYQSVLGDFICGINGGKSSNTKNDEGQSTKKEKYVRWWHSDGDLIPTQMNREIKEKMIKMKFDFVVDEPKSTIFINPYKKPNYKKNIHDDVKKSARRILWLILKNIDDPDGFGLDDIKKLFEVGEKKIEDNSCYQYVTSCRRLLGFDSLGSRVLPRRKPPYRPASKNKFSCCWILESIDINKSKLRTY